MEQIQKLINQIRLQQKKHSNATYIPVAILHEDAKELLIELEAALSPTDK